LNYELEIQPIFVQNGPAGNIAVLSNYSSELPLFEAATQKVYAQAGIRVVWDAPVTYTNSAFYTLDGTGYGGGQGGTILQMQALVETPGHSQSANPQTLNLYFTGANGGVLGTSDQSTNWVDPLSFDSVTFKNGGTVSESVFNSLSGNYSLTTTPHEIGHVLGLNHDVVLSGPPYYSTTPLTFASGNLMYAGLLGATTLGSIWNGTTGVGILSANDVALLRLNTQLVLSSPGFSYDYSTGNVSAVPEPSEYALAAGLLAGLYAIGRKWKTRGAASGK